MSKHNNGGRAFPVDSVVERDEEGRMHGFQVSSGGMTLRDYFAAKFMQGVCANPDKLYDDEPLAKEAYAMADAMLRAREAS